jgi:alanyl-tRNA synthetase
VLIARADGLGNNELKQLAIETVRKIGSGVVGLVGAIDGKAFVAVALSKDVVDKGASADEIARPAAKALGGNVGKGTGEIAGGGKNVDAIDTALGILREQAAPWRS